VSCWVAELPNTGAGSNLNHFSSSITLKQHAQVLPSAVVEKEGLGS